MPYSSFESPSKMVSFALALAVFGSASAAFSASTPTDPVRLRDLVKRGGTVTGPVLPLNFPDPALILPNGQAPWYVCTSIFFAALNHVAELADKHTHRFDLVFTRQSSLRNFPRF
jgi:hypothetical protein